MSWTKSFPTDVPLEGGSVVRSLDSLHTYGQRRTPNLGLLGWSGRLALAFVLVDVVAIALGFSAAVLAADLIRVLLAVEQIAGWHFLVERSHELMLLAGLAIGIFAFGGLYRRSGWEVDEIRKIVAGICLVGMFDATLQFALSDHNSRIWAMVAYPLVALSVISGRMMFRALPALSEALTSHIILLGNGTTAESLIYELRESRAGHVNLLRALPLEEVHSRDPLRLIQMLDRLARSQGIPAHRVQIVLAPAPEEIETAQKMLRLLNAARRTYSVVLPFMGLARNGLNLQKVVGADMIMAEMHPTRQPPVTYFFKRVFDFIFAAVLTLLFAPVLLFVAALLMLEGGPVFFMQPRVGRNGRVFRCFKFRSMRVDAQERLQELLATDPAARHEWERYQKLHNDPRITTLGKFIRKTSLDELPQLFNVLLGDMSLVGPRPIISPDVKGYPGDRSYYDNPDFTYYKRCTPGITGLWQVSGRSNTSHEERIRLDRWYARNWSFWLDFMILLKTIRVVLFRGGSI